ncbi:ABC transporter ATP-binding protein, partial [Candidatus Pseudothioglobus singularis]|nr:ABC transporter ATP-binding protein [Candidatus Pseudothioglobus singularis]
MGLTAKKIENSDQTQKQDLRILLQLSSFIKPYKKIAFVAFIALIITSLSFLLLGQGIKLFIDEGIYNLSRNELFVILLVLMTLVFGTF